MLFSSLLITVNQLQAIILEKRESWKIILKKGNVFKEKLYLFFFIYTYSGNFIRRNVLAKNHRGVFGDSEKLTDGFNMNLVKKTDCDTVPSSSIRDMSVPASKYHQDQSQFNKALKDTVTVTNQSSPNNTQR